MAEITHLPDELFGIILENESISIEDIIRFKSTCKKLHRIALSNCFWRKKFYQRCSTATKIYYTRKPKKTFYHIDFEEQTKTGMKCIKKLQYYVSLIANNNLSETSKKELENLLLSAVKNSMIYHFVSDELNRIIIAQSWPLDFHLTIKYNFELIFRCLKPYRFIYKLTKFFNKPYEKQLLERQVTIMAQYFQPHISYSDIETWLDDIAQEVLSCLKIINPAHPIFTVSLEQFNFWKTNYIFDNYWDTPEESIQIMRILEKHIFSKLEIDKLFQLLMISDTEVHEHIPDFFRNFLLPITYQSVARRLGIRSITMAIDKDSYIEETIKIIWKPKYDIETWDNAEYFYMKRDDDLTYPSNIFRGKYYNNASPRLLNNGRKLDVTEEPSCLLIDVLILNQMWLYLIEDQTYENNKYCKWKLDDLFNFLNDCTKNPQQTFNKKDKYIKIQHTYYKKIIKAIQIKSDVAIEKQLQKRNEKIKYAVGMIVTHCNICRNKCIRRNDSFSNLKNHDGVIIGWSYNFHEVFSGRSQFSYLCSGFNDMGCVDFIFDDQLYYTILAEHNKICYVRQDQISICPPKEIDNIEIGQFFYRFEGTHYVPNKNLEENYPNDTAAISKILFNHKSNTSQQTIA